MTNSIAQFIQHLLHFVTNTHILHLQSLSYSEHMALGAFYSELDELTDALTESIQGKYGLLTGYTNNYQVADTDALSYLEQISAYVSTSRRSDWYPQDSEIQNDTDSIQTLINSTIYKLRYLK
jgi:hypothetical protein